MFCLDSCRDGEKREFQKRAVVFNRTLATLINEYFTQGQKSSKLKLKTSLEKADSRKMQILQLCH